MNKVLFTLFVVVLGCSLAEGCRGGGRFPRPRPRPPPGGVPGGGGNDEENKRFFLSDPSSDLMYLGTADGKDFYAALNVPMDWDSASDYCAVSRMDLASSEQTDSQKELLTNVVNDVANAFGLNSANSPIRFWTSQRIHTSNEYDDKEEPINDDAVDECETISVSGTDMTAGSADCEEEVEITICEAAAKE